MKIAGIFFALSLLAVTNHYLFVSSASPPSPTPCNPTLYASSIPLPSPYLNVAALLGSYSNPFPSLQSCVNSLLTYPSFGGGGCCVSYPFSTYREQISFSYINAPINSPIRVTTVDKLFYDPINNIYNRPEVLIPILQALLKSSGSTLGVSPFFPLSAPTIDATDILSGPWSLVSSTNNIWSTTSQTFSIADFSSIYTNHADQVFLNGMTLIEGREPNIPYENATQTTFMDYHSFDAVSIINTTSMVITCNSLYNPAPSFYDHSIIALSMGHLWSTCTCHVISSGNYQLTVSCWGTDGLSSSGCSFASEDGNYPLMPDSFVTDNKFYLRGIPNLVDNAGELYFDTTAEPYQLSVAFPSAVTNPNTLSGTSAITAKHRVLTISIISSSNILIEGFHSFGGTANILGSNGIVLRGMEFKYISHIEQIGPLYVYDEYLSVLLDGTNNTILDSTILHSCGHLLMLSGLGNRAINNVLGYGSYDTYSEGAIASNWNINEFPVNFTLDLESQYNLLLENTAFITSGVMVSLGGGFNVILNDLYFSHLQRADLGILYGWGIDGYGVRIAFNSVHDCFGLMSPLPTEPLYGCSCIYLDNAARNFKVYRNLAFNCILDSFHLMGNDSYPVNPPTENNIYLYNTGRTMVLSPVQYMQYNYAENNLMVGGFQSNPGFHLLGHNEQSDPSFASVFDGNLANNVLLFHPPPSSLSPSASYDYNQFIPLYDFSPSSRSTLLSLSSSSGPLSASSSSAYIPNMPFESFGFCCQNDIHFTIGHELSYMSSLHSSYSLSTPAMSSFPNPYYQGDSSSPIHFLSSPFVGSQDTSGDLPSFLPGAKLLLSDVMTLNGECHVNDLGGSVVNNMVIINCDIRGFPIGRRPRLDAQISVEMAFSLSSSPSSTFTVNHTYPLLLPSQQYSPSNTLQGGCFLLYNLHFHKAAVECTNIHYDISNAITSLSPSSSSVLSIQSSTLSYSHSPANPFYPVSSPSYSPLTLSIPTLSHYQPSGALRSPFVNSITLVNSSSQIQSSLSSSSSASDSLPLLVSVTGANLLSYFSRSPQSSIANSFQSHQCSIPVAIDLIDEVNTKFANSPYSLSSFPFPSGTLMSDLLNSPLYDTIPTSSQRLSSLLPLFNSMITFNTLPLQNTDGMPSYQGNRIVADYPILLELNLNIVSQSQSAILSSFFDGNCADLSFLIGEVIPSDLISSNTPLPSSFNPPQSAKSDSISPSTLLYPLNYWVEECYNSSFVPSSFTSSAPSLTPQPSSARIWVSVKQYDTMVANSLVMLFSPSSSFPSEFSLNQPSFTYNPLLPFLSSLPHSVFPIFEDFTSPTSSYSSSSTTSPFLIRPDSASPPSYTAVSGNGKLVITGSTTTAIEYNGIFPFSCNLDHIGTLQPTLDLFNMAIDLDVSIVFNSGGTGWRSCPMGRNLNTLSAPFPASSASSSPSAKGIEYYSSGWTLVGNMTIQSPSALLKSQKFSNGFRTQMDSYGNVLSTMEYWLDPYHESAIQGSFDFTTQFNSVSNGKTWYLGDFFFSPDSVSNYQIEITNVRLRPWIEKHTQIQYNSVTTTASVVSISGNNNNNGYLYSLQMNRHDPNNNNNILSSSVCNNIQFASCTSFQCTVPLSTITSNVNNLHANFSFSFIVNVASDSGMSGIADNFVMVDNTANILNQMTTLPLYSVSTSSPSLSSASSFSSSSTVSVSSNADSNSTSPNVAMNGDGEARMPTWMRVMISISSMVLIFSISVT